MIQDNRMELYLQGKTDKEIAEEVGKSKSAVTCWRRSKELPVNNDFSELRNVPMEQALNPDQCKIIRAFFSSLLTAAEKCRGKKDVGRFMQTWQELYEEGKVMSHG